MRAMVNEAACPCLDKVEAVRAHQCIGPAEAEALFQVLRCTVKAGCKNRHWVSELCRETLAPPLA